MNKITSIEEIRDDWKREWCKKNGIPYESYMVLLHRRIPESKNEKYIRKLIMNGLDNDIINKRLEKYRKIRVHEDSLNKERDYIAGRWRYNKNIFVGQFIREGLDNDSIRRELMLIKTELSDEYINKIRRRVKIHDKDMAIYEKLSLIILHYENITRDNDILLNKVHDSLDHCPFCLSFGEEIKGKLDFSRFERERGRNIKHYNKAKQNFEDYVNIRKLTGFIILMSDNLVELQTKKFKC